MNSSKSLLQEIVGTLVSKVFDPLPIVFKAADKAGIGPVRTGCKKPPGTLHPFRAHLNRNAFLCGCHDFTADAPIEHLIVGFGFLHGSTTVVENMVHATGTEGSVDIPDHVAAAIRAHVQHEHGNEVLLFHNHPRNPINVVFDNEPLPSSADRRSLVSFHRDLVVLGKAVMGGGRVRFYVGENGFVQEFRTPDLLPVIARAAAASKATQP